MSLLHAMLAPDPMAHRPPLRKRFWVYSTVAYLAPVVVQVAWPDQSGLGDELIWLVTLVPAFLLSLHYGLRGALVGLLLGTALFVTVETVLALYDTPDDWRITLPIWIAYGTIAISVGWLSEELHTFYRRALQAERLAAIGEASLALRHRLSDALSVVGAQADLLLTQELPSEDRRQALQAIREANDESARLLQDLTRLADAPPTLLYSTGERALDLSRLRHIDVGP
jgi:glucose-6-phosphate-specific signal transduction histidine kinase